jgi:hypothetical protein
MPERPRARVVHASAGRVRLRIPTRRRNEAYFAALRDRLGQQHGVERVETNPATGSVLLHGADIGSGTSFLETLRDIDLFLVDLIEPPEPTTPVPHQVRQHFRRIEDRLQMLTGRPANIGSLVFFGFVGLGLYQLVRGNIASPATTLFWNAASVLRLCTEESEAVPREPRPT